MCVLDWRVVCDSERPATTSAVRRRHRRGEFARRKTSVRSSPPHTNFFLVRCFPGRFSPLYLLSVPPRFPTRSFPLHANAATNRPTTRRQNDPSGGMSDYDPYGGGSPFGGFGGGGGGGYYSMDDMFGGMGGSPFGGFGGGGHSHGGGGFGGGGSRGYSYGF